MSVLIISQYFDSSRHPASTAQHCTQTIHRNRRHLIPISNPRRQLVTPPSECRRIAVLVCKVLVAYAKWTYRPCDLELWPLNPKTVSLLGYHFSVYSLHRVWTIWDHSFLSRVSILLLTRDIDIVIQSVRLSVRLSVCPWHSGIVWKRLNISS